MVFRLILAGLLLTSGCASKTDVDMIIHNATIWTGNDIQPYASVMAIDKEKILAIGDKEILEQYRSENQVDAGSNFITPGFIDTHVHFLSGGFGLSSVKLRDASSPEEFTKRIGDFAVSIPEGTWITEGDWDHQLWGGELPRADWIDEVTPNHPVMVTRLDGHISLANSRAMELAGVAKNTPDVEGGEIVRYPDRTPTGIFKDNAQQLIFRVVSEPTPAQTDKAIIDGMNYVASKGVTTVHNMDQASIPIIEKYKRIRDSQITRFYMAVELKYWDDLVKYIEQNGEGDSWLKIGVLKGMLDGALGSHTAAFYEPFTDDPSDRGFFLLPADTIYQRALEADKAGLQLAIHAIGDRANATLLDIYERIVRENGPRDRRLRIEHAQHLTQEDIPRFKQLEVIASMQPYHAIDDGRWAESVIGPERSKTTYAFKSLMDAGASVAFGSDWAVAPPTPLEGIYAAVTRRTIDGANIEGWVPGEKITVERALKAYTVAGAYASFDENIKGSLEVGKLADFVILERNLFEIDPVDIPYVQVKATYVGGKRVYQVAPKK